MLVLLIDSKNVVDTSCPKALALKSPSLALVNRLRLVNSELKNANFSMNDISAERL